jgi:hypothetical protein
VKFSSPLSRDASGTTQIFSSKSRFFRLALIAAAIAMVGATFAVNIRLNGNNTFEYGQGVYRITSCDQLVSVNLGSTSTSPYADNLSRVGNISLQGLDVARCANTSIRLKLYDSATVNVNLFTNPAYTSRGVSYPCCTDTGTAIILVIAAGATQATALQSTTLISPSGKNINQGDRSESLSYDAATGTFTVAFSVPLAIMRDVYKTTLESASNV